jgi:hypothetical protein
MSRSQAGTNLNSTSGSSPGPSTGTSPTVLRCQGSLTRSLLAGPWHHPRDRPNRTYAAGPSPGKAVQRRRPTR